MTGTPQDNADEPSTPYDLAVWLINFEFQDPHNRHMTYRELARIYATKIEQLVKAHEREADTRTLETIASLLNGDSNQVEVVKGYVRNKLLLRRPKPQAGDGDSV
jgi:hypothetical protein